MNENPLLDAVDALTKPRKITTVQKDDDTDAWLKVHTELHPPLLQLLIDGTGAGRGSPTSNIRIPIDADALEMWAQIRDLTKLWCKQLDASFIADDLIVSVRHWYLAHSNAINANKLRTDVDHDVTRMVQGWVRMIEKKYEPDEKREWTEACPAIVPSMDIDGNMLGHRRCGARRVIVGGEERFAIQLNVTTMTAECSRCHTVWEGERGVLDLRKATELAKLIAEEVEAERTAELTRLSGGCDTPISQTA